MHSPVATSFYDFNGPTATVAFDRGLSRFYAPPRLPVYGPSRASRIPPEVVIITFDEANPKKTKPRNNPNGYRARQRKGRTPQS